MVSQPTPTEEIRHPLLAARKVTLYVKRDDLIHPTIMGNKWRKLKYNLAEARRLGKSTILTMGGAHSNHIYATAAAGELFGFKTVGIIRGEELNENSNDTLQFAKSKGMDFQFIDRSTFKELRKNPASLLSDHSETYFLPEGGTNELAVKGCTEIVEEIDKDFDLMVCPIGTGGTFCGLVSGVKKTQHVLGISSLKGHFIKEEVATLLKNLEIEATNYSINCDYHFGGYGKVNHELIDFINWFKENFSVPLDPIYTGKCFFGVWNMISEGNFQKNIKIVILHTGGLQGIQGVNRKNEDRIT
ncbi:MAG: pyridoxal-phosphate dependent enzyme [Bacteroidota bacterium]